MNKHIVILGNGIAGITAARYIRKLSDHRVTVISAESDHFFARTALMYIYMGHMTYEHTKPYEDWFWSKNRIELKRGYVERINFGERTLHFAGGEAMSYDELVLAVGSTSNRLGWPGQDLQGVQGLYSLQDLERMERNTQGIGKAVVVGGGLIGVEMAEMLHSRDISVTFLVRERRWMEFLFAAQESALIERHLRAHGINLRLGTEMERIVSDDRGRACAVVTKSGEEIPCNFVGLAVGVRPNIDFLRDTPLELERGILVDDLLRTNIPHVYAIGDCAQVRAPKNGRRSVEALWYVGRIMGQVVARTLCGDDTAYQPGLWFNSAKFFNIEYQVYGSVAAIPPAGVQTLYWEHPRGDRSIRIDYRADTGAVLGFNLLGIRYRHEVCQRWIEEGRPLGYVLENLGAANFDPELHAQYEAELVAVYNRQHPDRPVLLKRKRGLGGWLSRRRSAAGELAR